MVSANAHGSGEIHAQLVERLRSAQIKIPPYPAVAHSLERLSRDPRSSIADVTKLVATDATLAATVLRHSASAAMKSTGPTSLEAAVKKLGLDELTRVVLATTVGAVAGARGPLASLRRDQWRRSLLAAMFCRELAQRRGLSPDEAFLAGLLHDFGALVVLSCLESLGTAGLPALPEVTWRRLVEDHHIEHGMVVVARWKLPEPIAEVIAHHHAPELCVRTFRPLVQLVAIVDQIIAVLDRPGGGVAALVEVPGLEADERARIGAVMPQVADQMARFETPADRETTSLVLPAEPEPPPSALALADGWPVDFPIASRSGSAYRAIALAPTALAFTGAVMLQAAWLVELTLQPGPAPFPLLAHVVSCRPADGGYLMTARPFGLDGDDELAWRRLIERTQSADPARR
jgi:HD-like signal output (HDOD) protein